VPLRIDLRDYGTWLDGSDPFAESNSTRSPAKPRRLGAIERFLVAFLATLTESDSIDLAPVEDLLDRFAILIVFDGLDEVAQRETRQRVVAEIEKFIGRWRGGSTVPPKLVVTTRPNVSDLPEPSAQWFEPITLLKLDHELRVTYLRKWCAARGIASRAKRELMHSFDARTAEPHIAQLAENPMQLTILLYLRHLQGHSVPDKRTPLYDDYMKTFLNREAEKSASVRDNRENLEEVTAYLGWHLQGLAEQQGSNGRLSTTDLKTEIFRYLTIAQKDTGLVDALFTDVTDRVWALASKAQGTFEFDVQPVREFFAAKYLSQYASADKSEVLKELMRRPFWFNTSRFFAGFAHANELGGLVDGLTEEFTEARHPLSERVATWTLLADGVFSSKTTAQRRALELLCDDLSVRLLLATKGSAEPLPTLAADRGAAMLCEQLLAAASDHPAEVVSQERITLATQLGVVEHPPEQWWLEHARPILGGREELAWLRLGEPVAGGRLLEPQDLSALSLAYAAVAASAVAAGVVPPAGSPMEQNLMTAVLSGHCSDVVSPRTGLVPDVVNVLAPREFIRLAKAEDRSVFEMRCAHCDELMPTLKRQDAFRRLKKVDAAFDKIQRAMNTVRRSTNTVAPWSEAAQLLRGVYGPSWLSTDIAVIGAAVDPSIRRDVGPMNPNRAAFGPDIDYGRLVNDVRRKRNDVQWWLDQRETITASDRAVWAYALVAVANPTVVEACVSQLKDDVDALAPEQLAALMTSSSRLGLSQISRRLPPSLAAAAVDLSLPVGLLVTHHTDMSGNAPPSLLSAYTTEVATLAARFGPAGWPALQIAGISLFKTGSPDWLAVLEAHGPAAAGGVAQGPLPDELCERILDTPNRYPRQWIIIAEHCRSQRTVEQPLLASASGWFED